MDMPITATALLGEDHQRIREYYQKLDQAPTPADQEGLIRELIETLEIHTWMEERLVYPILAKACQEDSLAHRLDEAHSEIKRLISEFRLKERGDGAEGRMVLARLMATFEEHAREEEEQAFPLLAAGVAHNEELGTELARLRGKMSMFPPFAHAIDLAVPLRVAYNQWTQFEDFPRFLDNVKEVRQLGDTRVQWHAELAGMDIRWTAEIYQQIPDARIAWRSVEGALNAGSVSFMPLDASSTRVLAELTFEPQGLVENIGAMAGVLSRHVASSLQSYKEFLERTRTESGAWRGTVEGSAIAGRDDDGRQER